VKEAFPDALDPTMDHPLMERRARAVAPPEKERMMAKQAKPKPGKGPSGLPSTTTKTVKGAGAKPVRMPVKK
jgi:hypothetical protein